MIRIMIGLTILADTAAWPMMMAPTIPMVGPSTPGTRRPPSRISSNASSMMAISTRLGKGTCSLAATMLSIKSVGMASGWWRVMAR